MFAFLLYHDHLRHIAWHVPVLRARFRRWLWQQPVCQAR